MRGKGRGEALLPVLGIGHVGLWRRRAGPESGGAAVRRGLLSAILAASAPPRSRAGPLDALGPGAVCPLLIGALGSSAIRARWTRTDGSPISSSPPSPSARNAAPRASSSIAGCSRRKARMLFISRASRSGPSQCPPRAGGGPGRPIAPPSRQGKRRPRNGTTAAIGTARAAARVPTAIPKIES